MSPSSFHDQESPIMGDDRLIINIKKLYADAGVPTLHMMGMVMKHYPSDKIPEKIAQYRRDLPKISKVDPLLKAVQQPSSSKLVISKGDLIIFERGYESGCPLYARIVI